MFRILIALLVLHSTVLNNECGFTPYLPPKSLEGGLISSSTTGTYAISSSSVKKSSINQIKFYYDILDKVGGVVPKILGASGPDKNENCMLYFENVFTMDIQIYLNTNSIHKTFMKMIEALEKVNYATNIEFSKFSFVYHPSSQTFLFRDLERLVTSDKLPDGTDFIKFAQEYFLDWIIFNGIAVLSSDVVAAKSDLRLDPFLHFFQMYQMRYNEKLREREFKIQESIDFNPSRGETTELEVKITKEERSSILTATLNNKRRSFTFDTAKDMFMIYVCQNKGEEVIDCINLDEKVGGQDLVWKYSVLPNQRIDVEVQEAESTVEDSVVKFFKVNLILTPEKYPGVIPEDEFLFKLDDNEKLNDYYLLCETNHNNLRAADKSTQSFKFKSIKMKNGPVINKTGRKIIQVIRSIFDNKVETCLGSNKKTFIIKKDQQDQNNYLLINKQTEKSPIDLIMIAKMPGIDQNVITSCNKPLNFPDIFFILNPELDPKKATRLHSYPEKASLTENNIRNHLVEDLCFHFDQSSQSYTVDYEIESVYVKSYEELEFRYNFNSHDKENHFFASANGTVLVKNVVFLDNKHFVPEAEIDFRNFQFPEFHQSRIFISIDTRYRDEFIIRSIFVSENNQFKEITTLFGDPLVLSTKPSKIIYNKKNSCIFSDPGEFLLKEIDSNYLTKIEIVFSVDITGFEGCKPIIESVTDQGGNQDIKITCSFIERLKFWKSAGTRIKSGNTLTHGLRRVIKQTTSKDRLII